MEQEKIYVVVPVYKVEPYLERCVESILNQTYDNYELILVDDGSPDNCPAICDRYAEKYDHITVIHQENGGLSAARNAGIEYALKHGDKENDWINFIDSDDFVHPKYLEYLYRAAKEAGTNVSVCGFARIEKETDITEKIGTLEYECLLPEDYWTVKRENADVAWGKLYKLFLIEKIRYPKGLIHEDAFTTYKMVFQCTYISVIWMKLYYYCLNTQSITASTWTPKRMVVLDALEEQLVFFEREKLEKAYSSTLRFLYWFSVKWIMLARGESPRYDHLIMELRKRHVKIGCLFVKEFGLVKAVSYWFEIRILGPAKRVLRKESPWSFVKRKLLKFISR